MMKKILPILGFCLLLGLKIKAQKLPEIQIAAVPVPKNIRIDGKDLEWNNIFAAENKRTELFYNLTNDAKNLYLILKSTNSTGINKIMLGGITFMVNLEGKKKEKNALSVTYPLLPRNNASQNRNRQGQNRAFNGQNNFSQNTKQRDSLMSAVRKSQLAAVKEIKIFGFKNIADTLISIYNEFGIKAVASVNNDGLYFYELAIPLNDLGLASDEVLSFAYQIKINGLTTFGAVENTLQRNQNNFGAAGRGFGGANNVNSVDLTSPTSFWGKYTLIK